MCTVMFHWRSHPAAELAMGLNRDEFLDRPAAPLHVWEDPDPARRVIAGRDLRSGGTWFAAGMKVTAALTNHRTGLRSRPGVRSRGDLVLAAARSGSAAEARAALAKLPIAEFGSFHLVAAGPDGMVWITNREMVFEAFEVAPGPHVLGNYGLDNPEDPVVTAMRAELEAAADTEAGLLVDVFKIALAGHGPGRPCLHLGPYGTRSSAVLLRGGPSPPRLRAADGPPCSAAWSDLGGMMERFLRGR